MLENILNLRKKALEAIRKDLWGWPSVFQSNLVKLVLSPDVADIACMLDILSRVVGVVVPLQLCLLLTFCEVPHNRGDLAYSATTLHRILDLLHICVLWGSLRRIYTTHCFGSLMHVAMTCDVSLALTIQHWFDPNHTRQPLSIMLPTESKFFVTPDIQNITHRIICPLNWKETFPSTLWDWPPADLAFEVSIPWIFLMLVTSHVQCLDAPRSMFLSLSIVLVSIDSNGSIKHVGNVLNCGRWKGLGWLFLWGKWPGSL